MGLFQKPRSPRKSELFQSRLLEAGRKAAPIRHAHRLREDLAGEVIKALILAGFLVALCYFARAVLHLFASHGGHLNPWYLRMSLGGVLVCFVLILRRLILRIGEIRWLRAELKDAQQKLQEMREEGKRPPRD